MQREIKTTRYAFGLLAAVLVAGITASALYVHHEHGQTRSPVPAPTAASPSPGEFAANGPGQNPPRADGPGYANVGVLASILATDYQQTWGPVWTSRCVADSSTAAFSQFTCDVIGRQGIGGQLTGLPKIVYQVTTPEDGSSYSFTSSNTDGAR